MKMNKILAAGIAATMAVTSMAAVVSAEPVTFSMAQTQGTSALNNVETYFFKDNVDTIAGADVKGFTAIVSAKEDLIWDEVTAVTLQVTGNKWADSTKTDASTNETTETYSFDTTRYYDGSAYLTFKDTYVNKAGEANLDAYAKITGIKLLVSVKGNVYTAAQYDAANGLWGNGQAIVDVVFTEENSTKLADLAAGDIMDEAADWAAKGYADFLDSMVESKPADAWYNADRTTKDIYSFIFKTTTKTTIDRYGVVPLSKTDAKNSASAAWSDGTYDVNGNLVWADAAFDANQKDDGTGTGDTPYAFAGLAGQVAKYFNKQENGTITFKFTDAASTSTAWNNGGIPSTEIGLLGQALASTSIALFVNYESTTGALVAMGKVDASSCTVEFDMSEILTALNGNTIGTIHDIYYACNTGIDYKSDIETVEYNNIKGFTGYLVESVTLAYDEDADEDEDVADDDDDAEVEDDDDDAAVEDDDDDAAVEDDDDDAVIEDDADDEDDGVVVDEDDDDAEVGGEVVVVVPSEDDDANPGTGVALAVIPALVAGAAVVVSKKRK